MFQKEGIEYENVGSQNVNTELKMTKTGKI